MTTTAKLGLELLANGAANQVLANQNFLLLSQLIQGRVLDKDLSTPPVSPTDGAAYIVGGSPAGAWAGRAGQIAYWYAATNAWAFATPYDGWQFWVIDEAIYYRMKAGAWVQESTASGSLDRANHTGTQLASTISDFSEAAQDTIAGMLVAGTNITLTYNDAANTLTISSSGGSGGVSLPAVTTFTGNKTLALTDINTFAVSQDATAQLATLPAQASVAWTADAEIHLQQGGAGALTITAASGVSINGVSAASFVLGGQYSAVTLKRRASNDWTLMGVTQGNQTITGNLALAGNNRVFSALLDGTSNSSYVQTSAANAATTLPILPSGTGTSATLSAYNKSDKSLQFFTMGISPGSIGMASWAGGGSALPLALSIGLSASWQVDASSPYAFRPGADNTQPLGTASFRCSTIYAGTGTINTSDAREKTPVRPLTSAEIECGLALSREIGGFQFLASTAEKGDAARTHIGMTVQRAIELLEQHDLSPFAYSFICYDQWDEQPEVWEVEPAREAVIGEDGAVITEAVEEKATLIIPHLAAGDRFSFRETGLIQFMLRALSADRDRLESRLAALESRP